MTRFETAGTILRMGMTTRVFRSRTRVLLVAAVTLVALAATTGQAHAQVSAPHEYTEDIPTSGGSTPTTGQGTPKKTKPPADVAERIRSQGGSDAPFLEEIVSSSAYGAPQTTGRQAGASRTGKAGVGREQADGGGSESTGSASELPIGDPDRRPSVAGAVPAAIGAVDGGDPARTAALLGAIGVILAIALTALALRHRRRSA